MKHALAGRAVSNEQVVTPGDLPFEFMLNALRLAEGFDLALWLERTGLVLQVLQPGIDQGLARGWLQRVGPRLVPTTRGFDFLNDVQQLFLVDPA
jgi:coproporphyrinogen III oxidase-like Fe-S oxidoreductase